jgi:alpha-glucosidase (family GH31 glycosyl hydrolase)
LHLSLPQSGGVRIHADDEGFFKPADLLPLSATPSNHSYLIETTNGKVVVDESPFAISFYDTAGNQVLHIGTHDLAFRFNQQNKITAVDFKTQLAPDESIFGFGERYDHFNQNGRILTLWGTDDWIGNTIGLRNQTYKPIPIYHSSRQYMVFDNSSYRLRADIGKTRPDELRLTQQGPVFDYYFWISPPEKALESYTALTGKPVLPPKWAFEPWMGRTGRGWNKPSNNMVAEEDGVTKQFEKLDIPHSAIYAEGGGNAESPELNRFMAARGIKVLSWFYPVISQATQAKLMPEIISVDLPVLHTWDPWDHVDFTNPNALELMRRVWNQRLSVGVAGSMIDFGDRVTEDAVFHNGKHGDEMHNFYSYDYHRTCAEVFREKRGDDFILFGRAAAPGTQKWVAQFAGDHPSNFKGLQSVLTGALNLCGCGFSTWGSDLGGFLGWPEPAVYMRWTQFACFSPLMRSHGRTPREPGNYGDDAIANYKCYAWIRENLLNYIYDSAIDAHTTGIPMIRSMAVAFPDDVSLATVSDQYMFGPHLLVAPVVDENNSRVIHFPSGQWTSLWNGKTISGPANLRINVPLDTIPVFLKSGAIIPVQLDPLLQFGASMSRGRVNALLLTPPIGNIPVSSHNEQVPNSSAALRQLSDGLEIYLKNDPVTDFLLIFNTNADTVKMDGQMLPKSIDLTLGPTPSSWYSDTTHNRLVIRLPSGQPPQNHVFTLTFSTTSQK